MRFNRVFVIVLDSLAPITLILYHISGSIKSIGIPVFPSFPRTFFPVVRQAGAAWRYQLMRRAGEAGARISGAFHMHPPLRTARLQAGFPPAGIRTQSTAPRTAPRTPARSAR